jgi:hypothetical protein
VRKGDLEWSGALIKDLKLDVEKLPLIKNPLKLWVI